MAKTMYLIGWRAWALVALLVHLLASIFWHEPAFFIPDEIIYFKMTEALSHGRLWLETGYEEFASPMLISGLSTAHEGKVYAQYPAIYAALALPFYVVLGASGLFAINQLSLIAIAWLVYRIQRQLFESERSAIFAGILAVFGGYLWVYSQTIAPHLLQVALLLGAALSMLRARYVLAGALFGLALGVRYDSLFALPMLVLPLVFVKPVNWRGLALLLPGILAALAILSYTNHIKFGSWMPFSYDTQNPAGHASFKPIYLYIAATGFSFLAVLWAGTRLHTLGKLPSPKKLMALGGLAFVVAAIVLSDWLLALLYGVNLTVVDYSSLPLDASINASASRTQGGGFLYLGEYKRALLQSAPFIALISLLALQSKLKTPPREWAWLCWLALAPAAFIFFFSLLRWEGGFAYHMRYYTPTLPFFAMMAAQALHRFLLAAEFTHRRDWRTPLLVGAAISIAAVLYADGAPEAQRETLLLKLPLWLWGGIILAGALAFYDGAGKFMRQCAVMVMGFAMLWGGASSLLIIYPHLLEYKARLNAMSASYADALQKDALVISVPRHFTTLLADEERRLRIATIYSDPSRPVTPEDVQTLLAHYIARDVPVYITHDVKALPLIRRALGEWGLRLAPVRAMDEQTGTPALSQFIKAEK